MGKQIKAVDRGVGIKKERAGRTSSKRLGMWPSVEDMVKSVSG